MDTWGELFSLEASDWVQGSSPASPAVAQQLTGRGQVPLHSPAKVSDIIMCQMFLLSSSLHLSLLMAAQCPRVGSL